MCFFPFIFLLVRVACKSTAVLISALFEKGKKEKKKDGTGDNVLLQNCSMQQF